MSAEDWLIDRLLEGASPLNPGLRELFLGAVRDSFDTSGSGVEPVVSDYLDLFSRFPEARLRMKLARSAGIPYSEAMTRWASTEDLAAEIAFSALEAIEHWGRCAGCGVDPDDVLTEDRSKPLPQGKWRISKRSCFVCGQLAMARKSLNDQERSDGTDYRVVPRPDGDRGPFIDHGGPDRG